MMRWAVAAAVVLASGAGVLGCGGGDAPGDAASRGTMTSAPAREADTRADERRIREATAGYYDAFLAGDGAAACSFLSEAAKEQILTDPDAAEWGDTCAERLSAGAALVRALAGQDATYEIRRVDVAGDRALVVAVFAGEREETRFEREDGEWRVGPDGGSDGSERAERESVDLWPDRWCDVRVGMTRSQVRDVMGEPTDSYAGESSQDQWEAFQWSFTVFYRHRTDIPDPADEPAYQLQASDAELTDADRARIECPLTRR